MKNLEELQKQQTRLEDEIQNLTGRRDSVVSELEQLKATIGTDKEPKGGETKLRDLISTRETFAELIEEKSNQLQQVIDHIQPLQQAIELEGKKKELVKLAKAANDPCKRFYEAKSELNQIIQAKVRELISFKREWKKTSETFMDLADTIEPGFRSASFRKIDNAEGVYKLLEEIGEQIDLSAVTSDAVLQRQYYPFADGQVPCSSKGLMYNVTIEKMMEIQINKESRELNSKAS